MAEYLVGKKVQVFWDYTDLNDEYTDPDPAGVILRLRKPDGTETNHVYQVDANVIKDKVGRYHYDFVPTTGEVGNWLARAKATSGLITAEEHPFTIIASGFTTP